MAHRKQLTISDDVLKQLHEQYGEFITQNGTYISLGKFNDRVMQLGLDKLKEEKGQLGDAAAKETVND